MYSTSPPYGYASGGHDSKHWQGSFLKSELNYRCIGHALTEHLGPCFWRWNASLHGQSTVSHLTLNCAEAEVLRRASYNRVRSFIFVLSVMPAPLVIPTSPIKVIRCLVQVSSRFRDSCTDKIPWFRIRSKHLRTHGTVKTLIMYTAHNSPDWSVFLKGVGELGTALSSQPNNTVDTMWKNNTME